MIAIVFMLVAIIVTLIIIIVKTQDKQPIKLTSANEIDLADVMPIQYIDENMAISATGDITVGYKLILPEVFTLSPEDANQIHGQLTGLLKLLPPLTVFHQQNFYYTSHYDKKEHSENYLMNEQYNMFVGKEILQSYTNIYITFKNQNTKKSAFITPLIKKPKTLLTEPFKDILQRKKEIESTLINFENSISSINYFSVIKMKNKDLNNAIYDYINQSYHTPTNDATKEVVQPISVSDNNDLKIGNTLIKVISLVEEGSKLDYLSAPLTAKNKEFKIDMPEAIASKASMIYPIALGLPFNHIVNTIIEITDQDAVISEINKEKQALNFIANFYPPAKEKQKEQEAFVDALIKHNYQTAYTSVNVIIADTDSNSLQRKTSYVQQGFIKMNHANCYIENEENANLFFSSSPGSAHTNYRGFINTTMQGICYLQKENMYLSSAEGFIFTDRFGTPCKVDMWNYPQLANRNRLIFGPSGSGKSFLLNNLILQGIEHKRDIVIIDIGGSYRSLVEINKGKYFDSNDNKKFQFNPFLCPQDKFDNYVYTDTEDEDSSDDHIKTLSTIIAFIWKGDEKITPTEKALLEKSIKYFYEHVNAKKIFPNMINYYHFLETYEKQIDDYERKKIDIKEVRILLEPYVNGDLKDVLNAKENIDIINDNLLAFDMEGVSKKDHFPIIAIILLNLVAQKIKRRQGIEKTLIIDEALDFLKDEKFGDFIAYLYRTFRKKEGEICLAAQNVLFLKSTSELIRDSIIINTGTKIILDHSEHVSNLKEIKNMLSMSDQEIDMIASLQTAEKWREFFLKLGNSSFIFRNEVVEQSAVAFDSRQKTVVRIKQLAKETGSIYTAINQYIAQKNVENEKK